MIELKHNKNNTTKSFPIELAEKALRKAIEKSKNGLKGFSCWELPSDSKYKFDNGKLIQIPKKKKVDDIL